jgi:hypothetical protein
MDLLREEKESNYMCFHKWEKWSVPFTSSCTKDSGHFGEVVSYSIIQQQRTCTKCGVVSARFVRDGCIDDIILTT